MTPTITRLHIQRVAAGLVSAIMLCLSSAVTAQDVIDSSKAPQISTQELGQQLTIGDVVFIRVPVLPFRKVASTTQSWTNHVGIVIDVSGKEPLIAESTFPFSKVTPLSWFVARSEDGRIEVSRLKTPLTSEQESRLLLAAQRRLGIFYDTGFDLHFRRQFCSRYVYEVLREATGTEVGDVETFSTLLARSPHADLAFWRVWYFGDIPWQRETITPASLLRSAKLHTLFDGYANQSGPQRGGSGQYRSRSDRPS